MQLVQTHEVRGSSSDPAVSQQLMHSALGKTATRCLPKGHERERRRDVHVPLRRSVPKPLLARLAPAMLRIANWAHLTGCDKTPSAATKAPDSGEAFAANGPSCSITKTYGRPAARLSALLRIGPHAEHGIVAGLLGSVSATTMRVLMC